MASSEYFEDDIKTEIDDKRTVTVNQCDICQKVVQSKGSLRVHIPCVRPQPIAILISRPIK